LKWTSLRRLTGGNGLPPRDNTNDLVGVYAGCDGLKTGTTLAAGYCLAATARRDGLRLSAVVMNNASKAGRFRRARELFDAGFQRVIQRVAVERGQMLAPEIPVVNGRGRHVRLCALEDLEVTIDRDDVPKLEIVVEHPEWLRAPVKAGEEQGRVLVRLEDEVLAAGRAAIATDVREADWRWKLEHSAFGGLGYAALRPGEEGDPETSKQLGVEGLAVPLAR
jgi:D-alanyl-D-alanine carboxypeptidase (penicillin-binding protein 5/6)